MSHWKAYATVMVAAALIAAPTTAHAEIVWTIPNVSGVDCAAETWVEIDGDGNLLHFPALPYEVEASCGHAPEIVWSDDEQSGEPVKVAVPKAPAQPVPVAQVEAPAPIVAPVVAKTATPVPHGHSIHFRAV